MLGNPNRPLRDVFRNCGGETASRPLRQELQEDVVPLGGMGRPSGSAQNSSRVLIHVRESLLFLMLHV